MVVVVVAVVVAEGLSPNYTLGPKTPNPNAVLDQLIQRCGGGTRVGPEGSQLALSPPPQSH